MDSLDLAANYQLKKFDRLRSKKFGIFRGLDLHRIASGEPALFVSMARQSSATRLGGGQIESSGASYSRVDCVFSGAGEAVERYAAGFSENNRILPQKSYSSIVESGELALDPKQMQSFSSTQYEQPEFSFQRWTEELPVDWVLGTRLNDGAPFWIPCDLISISRLCENKIFRATTSGLASGQSDSHAIVSGLLELIERDAFLEAWWTRKTHQQISIEDLRPHLERQLPSSAFDCGLRIVNMTGPLGVPVMVAVVRGSRQKSRGSALLVAAAANFDPMRAATKAIIEVSHCRAAMLKESHGPWLSLKEFPVDFDHQIKSFVDGVRFYSQYDMAAETEFLDSGPVMAPACELKNISEGNEDANLQGLLGRFADIGMTAYAVDLTTRDIRSAGLRVFRTLVPGLIPLNAAHRYRCLGAEKLSSYSSSLNPLPHPFP